MTVEYCGGAESIDRFLRDGWNRVMHRFQDLRAATSRIGRMQLRKNSDYYSGGVALGGGASAGDGIADAAMSFVFASSSSFFSSG